MTELPPRRGLHNGGGCLSPTCHPIRSTTRSLRPLPSQPRGRPAIRRSPRRSGWSASTISAPSSKLSSALSLPDLRGLLHALEAEPVDFVVIGGFAVVTHGYVRATEDLDLVPSRVGDNLDRLVNSLLRLDARLALAPDRQPGPEEREALYRGRNLSLTTRLGDVDIVQRLAGVPDYETLAGQAVLVEPFGVPVRVASVEHLVAMKRAGGRPIDHADLARLDPEG